jgi:hypothetical protein
MHISLDAGRCWQRRRVRFSCLPGLAIAARPMITVAADVDSRRRVCGPVSKAS